VTRQLMTTRILGAVLGATLLFGAGCNQNAKKSTKASETACEDYTKKICEEAGEQSSTCTSLKTAAEIMPKEACQEALSNIAYATKKIGEKRKRCDELVTKLCGDLGPETETCTMVKTRTKEFPPERCDMMMEHYDEVLADLKRQEEKNKPLSEEKFAAIAVEGAPSFGPKDAKVTIVEFSDFECPFCSRAADAVHKLKEKYGDKVHFIFRQFPLSFHKSAQVAAEASLAADAQGKFWEMHDKMFANQRALSREQLEGYAKEIGLDMAKFKKALDDKTFAAPVDADQKLGETAAVDGTPTMFLNGKRVANPTDIEALSKEIDAALGG